MSKQSNDKVATNNKILNDMKTMVVSMQECLQELTQTHQRNINMNERIQQREQSQKQQFYLVSPKTLTLIIIVFAIFIFICIVFWNNTYQDLSFEKIRYQEIIRYKERVYVDATLVCGNRQDYYETAYIMCKNRYENDTLKIYPLIQVNT